MESINSPHDKFFKQLLSRRESARDFLQHYLPPEVSRLLDLSTLLPLKDTFIDEQFRAHFSDLLYRVELQESGTLYIYILFEHKSHSDFQVAFQLLRYMVRIWEDVACQAGRFSPIFPLVIYHGEVPWKVGRNFQDLFDIDEVLKIYLPDYQYWLCDLSRYSDQDLKGNVLLQVGLLVLKYVYRDELAGKLPEIFKLLGTLTQQKTGLEYLESLLRYLASASAKLSDQDLQIAVKEAIKEGGEQIMPTLAQKWIEEGRQEGLTEGRKEGLEEGFQQGIKLGLIEAIEFGLDMKFSTRGLKELIRIRRIEDIELLRAIRAAIKSVNTLEELQEFYKDYIPEEEHRPKPIH